MSLRKIWKLTPPSLNQRYFAEEIGSSPLMAQLLINRHIMDTDSALSFFTPRLADLEDPTLLKDMDEAVTLILKAIDHNKSITIYGDYDADGMTATALLWHFFSSMGIPVSFHIPKRLTEGYGLNPHAIRQMAERGTGLMITVDCGISNMEEIALAKQLGMSVVVTDHHQIPVDFKPVCPVVNPHQPGSLFPFKDLAGVGVAFFLAVAVRTALREKNWFGSVHEPDLKDYLDLVALGTVADMVPLTGQNRILVNAGMMALKDTLWPGLKAMQEVSGVNSSHITSYDLAFRLSPRLNASGRVDDPIIGLEALIAGSMAEAMKKAEQLNHLNNRRQSIEGDILNEIEFSMMPQLDMKRLRTLVFAREGWHQGVLGIVASRLVDRYHRPTIVLSIQDNMATGSGRSIDGLNLHQALVQLSHLFRRFGGHYHAAGLSLNTSNLEAFRAGLEQVAIDELQEEDLIPTIQVDSELSLSDVSLDLVKQIQSLAPFGKGNPEPVFYADDLNIAWSGIVGENHLKFKVKHGTRVLDAIGFGLADYHPLDGRVIHMIYTPEVDRWQGHEKIQLRVVDLEVKGG